MCPKKRVLCVDDTPDTCEMLCALLGHHGYETQSTDDPAQVLDLARREPFDLYILDLRLPTGSGLDLCRDLRAFTDAPIIFYSGAAYPADYAAAFDAGAQAYIAKPHIKQLLSAVREALAGTEVDARASG